MAEDGENYSWANASTGENLVKPEEIEGRARYNMILTRNFIGLAGDSILLMDKLTGRTNEEKYVSNQLGGLEFPPQTLLMLDPIISPGMDLERDFGGPGFNVTMRFAYQDVDGQTLIIKNNVEAGGHNLYWRPQEDSLVVNGAKGGWDALELIEDDPDRLNWPLYLPHPPDSDIDTNWLLTALQPIPVS